MQKLIVKYGTAAHLALLAVAPLFLFPFCGDGTIATVLLWLTIPAVFWIFLEPSIRDGEMLHDARIRLQKTIVRDPLLWTALVLVVFTGVRALNTGVALAYDAEFSKWFVSSAKISLFPGVVGNSGYLPFAVTVAGMALIIGSRHAIGRSARMAYLFMSSAFAGLSAVIALAVNALIGNAVVTEGIACAQGRYSFVGIAFALHFLGGIVGLEAAFERKRKLMIPLFAFSVGGTAAGTFAFLPVLDLLVFAVAGLVLFAYLFAYALKVLPSSGGFRFLVVFGIFMVLGGFLIVAAIPESQLMAKIEALKALVFLPDEFMNIRSILSGIAFKTWQSHIWDGTGIGSFALDFRFGATPEAWNVLPRGVGALPNGWWLLLVERGLVGAVTLAVPTGLLLVLWFRRLVEGVGLRKLPHPACLMTPIVLAALGVIGTFSCSVLRADVLLAAAALLVVSANSFSRKRKR